MSTNMPSDLEVTLRSAISGEVKFDAATRDVYATDASMYAITPVGVVVPRDHDDLVATVEIATEHGVPVLPRGAGTSLCGQAVGEAVIIDCSVHLRQVVEINADARTARVQPGVVQDDLNRAVAPHGLIFAPDTSTGDRATLGGMVGNNSCGSRSARYGMTIDHVRSLDVVLADSSIAHLAPTTPEAASSKARLSSLEGRIYRELRTLAERSREEIATGYPPYWRRSGGYRLDRLATDGSLDLAKFVVGSEGTLVLLSEIEVGLVPLPLAVTACAGHFDSIPAAIAATDRAIAAGAVVIELVDDLILGLARSSPVHRAVSSIIDGEPAGLLLAEFHGDDPAEVQAQAAALSAQWKSEDRAYSVLQATEPADVQRLRKLRKSGLGLLMSAGQGRERALAFVEDTAVDPHHLVEYTQRFAEILARHNLRAGFYGHASAGCLHIRPFMDLTRAGEVVRMRSVAQEVRDLVREYGGSNSSEHGDGLARSEFNRVVYGDALYEAMREVKAIFDPANRLNPGKIVDAPAMTDHLRDVDLGKTPVAITTHVDFPISMRDTANACARVGECRKGPAAGGTMCPSYMATREEEHSTRGRANALAFALSSPDPIAALGDHDLHRILDLCLECKACVRECPLSIDMATLKSETLAHYYRQHGVPVGARLFGKARSVNRMGARWAPFVNWLGRRSAFRWVLERTAGIDRRRPLPHFETPTLEHWFERRSARPLPAPRGEVVLLADSFTTFWEPEIGRRAVELLELAGWKVILESKGCCGRPSISKGLLDDARVAAATLVDRLIPWVERGVPIVGIEPSCISTLRDDYARLLPGDDRVSVIAAATHLVQELLVRAVDEGSIVPNESWSGAGRSVVFHGHCHEKAVLDTAHSEALLAQLPGCEVNVLDAGCCGMAGSFGFEAEHYELSMQIGELRLLPAVRAEPDDAIVVATGVSCRQQIKHGTGRRALHPIEVLYDAVVRP